MSKEIKCPTCNELSTALGQVEFMRQGNSIVMGIISIITDRDAANLTTYPIDVFRCPKCGRLELYDLDRSLPQI
jgi:hypothetical protein